MHARAPHLPFLAAPAKGKDGNYKKRFIHAYTKEESLQVQPTSPKIEKPMPPLEPLPQAFIPNHPPPKKRLQTEHDDPMLSEAAASPSSFSDIDTKNQLMSVHMPSTPNSPWSMLSLPDTFSDSAYSSSSLMSPMNYVSSPGSVTQANSPVDFFPSTPLPTAPKVSSPKQSDLQTLQNDHPALPSVVEQQEQVDHKQCPRPQSVALDLTSLQKQKVTSNYTPSYPFPQQPPHLVSAPNHSSTTQLFSDEQKMNDIRMGFQGVHGNQARVITQTNHPLLSKHCFGDRPLETAPYVGPPKIMYAGSNQHGSVPSRMHRHLDGGGVIRPKPACVYPRSPPNHYIYPMSQRMKHLQHLYPGSQSRRMSHDVIYNSPRMSREMPSVSLPTPTASSKKLSWLHDNENHSSDHTSPPANPPGKPGYIEKSIVDWTHQDVVYYMIDSSRSLTSLEQDVNCSALGDITGRDLWHKTLDDFKLYSPNAAELLYHHFSERREKERRQHAVIEAGPIYHDMQTSRTKLETASFDFINEPTNVIQSTHHSSSHHLQQPAPSTLSPVLRSFASGCDASAPYEIRYETCDAKNIPYGDSSTMALYHGIPPTASGKSVDFLNAPSTPHPFDADESISDPDQSCNEEEVKPEPPKKRGPGRPRKPENELKKKKKKTGRLWEFIRNLLLDPETCPSLVRWENPEEGIFRFVQAEKVAQKWGERKKNKDMNYEKLSRAMRYYYKGGVFEAVLGRRLVYKFGKKAKGWQPPNPNFVNHSHFPGSSYSNL